MKSLKQLMTLTCLIILSVLSSCGGGGSAGALQSNNGGGIGGTGIVATGTIDGFGSIFVNGVEFETDSASVILDSESSVESALRLGMVVTVRGTVDANGTNGVANSVEFDDEVQGPVSSIAVNADSTLKTLLILGVTVVVDNTATVFDDVSFDTLAINDVVEVSGYYDEASVLNATRVEKKETFVAGVSEIEVKGVVSALSGVQFTLGTLTVDFSAADLSDVNGSALSEGLNVEVKGMLSGLTIMATHIEQEDDLFNDDENNVSVEGLITDYVSDSNFKVYGQVVDASTADFSPAALVLSDGVKIEVEGSISQGVLNAESVEAREGSVELFAAIESLSVDGNNGTLTLDFATGTVSFIVDSTTELQDQTGNYDPLSLTDFRVGHFLEVKALVNGSGILATEIRLEDPGEQMIQGVVDSFVSGSEITVLGLTYATPGEIFENENDLPITSVNFFSLLTVGQLVKIKDDNPANGIADEVEFED